MLKEAMTMRLTFDELYLFDPSEKLAKKIEFCNEINIITSSQDDGNDRGKSVIMRSLYHSLGAEAHYKSNWNAKNKVYILKITIDEQQYYTYRAAELFKFFNADKQLLFTSSKARDIAENLRRYFNFAVQLPNRNDCMEITPPAYNYLPFYLDQDHYAGNKYESFKNLGQYTNFKENVLYYHLGAYDEEYFTLVHEREKLKLKKIEQEQQLNVLQAMLEELDKKLLGTDYSASFQALEKDLALYKKEYSQVLENLSRSKRKLMDLRNHVYEIEQLLREMGTVTDVAEKKIKTLRMHKCPECGSLLTDTIKLKSKNYNLIEDVTVIKNDLQVSRLEYNEKIEREEAIYKNLLKQMEEYQEKLEYNNKKANDALKERGLSELRDDVISDKYNVLDAMEQTAEKIKAISNNIKSYSDKKKNIENTYYELMVEARTHFGINELIPESFKKLTNVVEGSGSNKNIVTVMWYLTILRLRHQYNSAAIDFPIVFDSLNNVETDNEKKFGAVQYVVDHCKSGQLILSLLGYKDGDIQTDRKIKVITLTNEKYHLLDAKSYEDYKDILEELCDISTISK